MGSLMMMMMNDNDDDDGLPSGVFAYVFQKRPRKTKKKHVENISLAMCVATHIAVFPYSPILNCVMSCHVSSSNGFSTLRGEG